MSQKKKRARKASKRIFIVLGSRAQCACETVKVVLVLVVESFFDKKQIGKK
jgi:hypothetical protein